MDKDSRTDARMGAPRPQRRAGISWRFFNQPNAAGLTAAFQQVATDLTDSRLIPECTAAPPAC
jgi:hypothetical protein